MKAEDVTREALAKALRFLRQSAGLTQRALAIRSKSLSPPLRRVLESQVSDFERGRALPSFLTLVSMVAACSADGRTVDFSRLQDALSPEDRPHRETNLRSDLAELRAIVAAIGLRVQGLELVIGESRNGKKLVRDSTGRWKSDREPWHES